MNRLMEIIEDDVLFVGRFIEHKRKAKNLLVVKFQTEGGDVRRVMIPINDLTLLQSYYEIKSKKCRIMVRSFKTDFDTRYKLLWIFESHF